MDLKENKGCIFKNEKKTAKEHPDYRGEINVKGEHFEISLWVNESKEGKKYFSASIKEPYRPAEPPTDTRKFEDVPAKIEDQGGDDLPF